MTKKISELSAAATLDGTEKVEAVQSGTSKQTTTQDVADLGLPQDYIDALGEVTATDGVGGTAALFDPAATTLGEDGHPGWWQNSFGPEEVTFFWSFGDLAGDGFPKQYVIADLYNDDDEAYANVGVRTTQPGGILAPTGYFQADTHADGSQNVHLRMVIDGGHGGGVSLVTGHGGTGASEPKTQLALTAVDSQTEPSFKLSDTGSATVFSVGPNGAITKLNGVTVPITGVAVTAAGVHAALVTLGLITA